MTRYRLKDKRVQKFLTDLLGKHEVDSIMERLVDGDLAAFCVNVEFDDGEFVDSIDKSDVQLVHEYNPNDWNYFPDVMPPEDVPMRIETVGGDKFCGYFHTFPDGVGRWCCACFTPSHMPLRETEKVRRYRPWE